MSQMYKVFIENTPVFILKPEDFKSSKGILILNPKFKEIRKTLFNCISINNDNSPIYIIIQNPKKAFQKIFKKFDFIYASGGIVKSNKGYLFIKRNGYWDIPKGKLEKNEKPKLGAIREIEEECGISKPKIDKFICETYHTYLYNGKPTIKKTYWFSLDYMENEKLKPQTEEGITKVKWFKKNEILKVKKNTFPSILDVIGNYFD